MQQTIWVEARLPAPQSGGPWFGDTFRQYVASRIQGDEWHRLFWRSAPGKEITGKPLLTFVAGRNWVGMRVATGREDLVKQAKEDAITMLQAALLVARNMDDDFGGKHHIETRQGTIEITDKRTSYHIRKLAIRSKSMRGPNMHDFAKRVTKGASVDEDTKALVTDLIGRNLAHELPMLDKISISPSKDPKNFYWGTPAVVGGKELVFVVRDLIFTMPVRINGPVQVGSLTSRGYGDIRRIVGGV